jgi:hypothetical protein
VNESTKTMSDSMKEYAAREKQYFEQYTTKAGRVEAIEPRHTPSTIGEALEVLKQRIGDCEKGVAVIEETLEPVLVSAGLEGTSLMNETGMPICSMLNTMLSLIERVEGVEYKLRTVCNRVQL